MSNLPVIYPSINFPTFTIARKYGNLLKKGECPFNYFLDFQESSDLKLALRDLDRDATVVIFGPYKNGTQKLNKASKRAREANDTLAISRNDDFRS